MAKSRLTLCCAALDGAHSIRCFARFQKWEVVDALMRRLYSTDAHPYQAPELPFYFLHARLWLLIAIARLAIDHPMEVAGYADELNAIAVDKNMPHVLMRHFAAQLSLHAHMAAPSHCRPLMSNAKEGQRVAFRRRVEEYGGDSFYRGRPDSMLSRRTNLISFRFDKMTSQR